MKVRELVAQLQELDPEMPVMLQSDPEGNGYFWASGADGISYVDRADLERDRTDSLYEVEDIDEGDLDEYIKVAMVFP